MRSHLHSAASTISASAISFSRTTADRAGLAARAAVQVLRRRTRRNLSVAVMAAVVVAGLIAGLVAALVPSGSSAPLAAASDTAPARQVTESAGHAGGTQDAGTAVKVQPGKTPAAKKAPAAKSKKQERPYSLYDSVTPSRIPGNHPVATYATGHYAVSPSQVARPGVTWIDTNGTDPKHSSVLDVEPGNVSPAFAAIWVKQRLTAHPTYTARVYTMLSQWDAVKASVATLPHWMQSHVKWWIADPTGVQHVVPGSDATQWYWGPNYDISTVNPGF